MWILLSNLRYLSRPNMKEEVHSTSLFSELCRQHTCMLCTLLLYFHVRHQTRKGQVLHWNTHMAGRRRRDTPALRATLRFVASIKNKAQAQSKYTTDKSNQILLNC
jgi:hypothetical protein